jgi:LmbE family N-acetylglucosaminyl deacetylase
VTRAAAGAQPAAGQGANVLAAAIERGVPLVVLSPHLDDAVLSCGALIAHAVTRTSVTVATLFTEAGPPPHTWSARRYLHQVGAADAETLYRQRRAEDRAALEPLGVGWVHAGLTEAQFRLRAGPGSRRWWTRLLPELAHCYPVYRRHVISGRIAPSDAGTLAEASGFIQRTAGLGRPLVLAPLGVGGHVDHVLTRTAAKRSGARVAYYSDFPYNQRYPADSAFIRRNGLAAVPWPLPLDGKPQLVRAYHSQMDAMFPGGAMPIVAEVYFAGPGTGTGTACGAQGAGRSSMTARTPQWSVQGTRMTRASSTVTPAAHPAAGPGTETST